MHVHLATHYVLLTMFHSSPIHELDCERLLREREKMIFSSSLAASVQTQDVWMCMVF